MDAFGLLANYLSSIGLGSLFSVDSNGNPGGWLWDQIRSGVDTKERLLLSLEQTLEFQQRFKIISDLRSRSMAGENVTVPTVADVLNYEDQYRKVMSRAGVPSWFYDSPDDAHKAMANNLAIEQIAERIDSSFQVVQSLPKEVRDVFSEYFGDATEASLVAAVLDPQKTLNSLEKATRAAVAGGFARRQGFELSASQAEEYAQLGRDIGQVQSDIQQVAALRPLQVAQAGEAPTIAEDAAFRAGALGEADVQRELEGRLMTRRLGQGQSAGGAFTSQQGVVGSGSAR